MPSSLEVLARLAPRVSPELVERARRWSGTAVAARASASVALLRANAAGLETYLLHRHARMAFAPSMAVFPGGGLEVIDGELDGSDGRDRLRACACRETAEETGVTLDPAELLPWAHWITPEFEPRRYDTFFYVVELPPGQHPRDISGETDFAAWTSPTAALAAERAGTLALMPPTLSILVELAGAGTLAGVRERAAGRTIEPVLPRLVEDVDGWHFRYPEAGHAR